MSYYQALTNNNNKKKYPFTEQEISYLTNIISSDNISDFLKEKVKNCKSIKDIHNVICLYLQEKNNNEIFVKIEDFFNENDEFYNSVFKIEMERPNEIY